MRVNQIPHVRLNNYQLDKRKKQWALLSATVLTALSAGLASAHAADQPTAALTAPTTAAVPTPAASSAGTPTSSQPATESPAPTQPATEPKAEQPAAAQSTTAAAQATANQLIDVYYQKVAHGGTASGNRTPAGTAIVETTGRGQSAGNAAPGAAQLPQTGTDRSASAIWGLGLFALASLFGFGRRKKRPTDVD